MTKTLISLLILIIIFSCAGCTSSSPQTSSSSQTGLSSDSSSSSLIDETVNVQYDHIQPFTLSGEKRANFEISVKTDGGPVDILILDTENYVEYDKAFETDVKGSWRGIIYRNIVSKSFSYTVPEVGTYYLVIENSKFTTDGADAKRDVNVAIKIE